MDWKPRISWGVLAILVGVLAWRLTVVITAVDRQAEATQDVVYDERPAWRLDVGNLDIAALQQARSRVPRVVVTSYKEAAFVVSSVTYSIVLPNVSPRQVVCRFARRVFQGSSMPALTERSAWGGLEPLVITETPTHGSLLTVPPSLHRSLQTLAGAQGMLACSVDHPLAASPTYTDRSITIHARNGSYGSVIFDVSALEDIDDLRFSGGIDVPLLGNRTRVLTPKESVVSAEWVDISSSEKRDIILVTIGALAAIGAAMAIEAVRPFIER